MFINCLFINYLFINYLVSPTALMRPFKLPAFLSRPVPWLLPCLLLGALASTAQANDAEQQKKLKALKENIEKLRKELEATKSSRDEINKSLEQTEKNIGELNKKSKEIERELQERKKKLNELRQEREDLSSKKREQENIVANYISSAYQLGNQGNLRLLLNQEDPARVSRNLKYYDYLLQARAEKISEFMRTIERINSIEPEIAAQAHQIQLDYQNLESQTQKLKQAQKERQQVMRSLEKDIGSKDQQLRSLAKDRDNLERILERVIENIADIKLDSANNVPFASLKGKLPWPTKGKILRSFGSQRMANNSLRWEGVLIGTREGDPVQAVHYGRIIFSDYLRGHGLLIIIDHGAGFMTLYAHNQALYKTLGEWVQRGETIAAVGNSGGQQQSALYFELRYKGTPANPQQWFRRA